MNHSPTASLPAQALANIPGVLGYYPHQSIIFATFRRSQATTFHLGPILRIDIDCLDVLPEVGEILTAERADVVLAFVITASPTNRGTTLTDITHALAQAADAQLIPIDACWFATSITNNGRYRLLFEANPSLITRGVSAVGWRQGRIANIAQAKATQYLLQEGDLPELTRQECFTMFNKAAVSPAEWEARASNVANLAAQLAVDAECSVVQFQAWFRWLESELTRLSEPAAAEPTAESVDKFAAMLSMIKVRDAALNMLLLHHQGARILALAVAQNFDAPIRNQALCVYALCTMKNRNVPKALHALMVSRSENPEHVLTQYVLMGYQRNLVQQLLAEIMDASTKAAACYGITTRPDTEQSAA